MAPPVGCHFWFFESFLWWWLLGWRGWNLNLIKAMSSSLLLLLLFSMLLLVVSVVVAAVSVDGGVTDDRSGVNNARNSSCEMAYLVPSGVKGNWLTYKDRDKCPCNKSLVKGVIRSMHKFLVVVVVEPSLGTTTAASSRVTTFNTLAHSVVTTDSIRAVESVKAWIVWNFNSNAMGILPVPMNGSSVGLLLPPTKR